MADIPSYGACEVKENLKPGPKPKARKAEDGTLCPPGSEGTKVYRGIRKFRRVCKYGGHRKPHPGRCVICRRESDRARDEKPQRVQTKRAALRRWVSKPGSKKKIAVWSKRRNERREQKDASAARMRRYRAEFNSLPESLQGAILALREVKQLIRNRKG